LTTDVTHAISLLPNVFIAADIDEFQVSESWLFIADNYQRSLMLLVIFVDQLATARKHVIKL